VKLQRNVWVKMRAAVYYGQHDIRMLEVPTPRINDYEILVRMKACGICGSDLMDWYVKNRAPLVLGHEPTGTIIERGRKVEKLSIGDRVFVHHHVACLTCHYCLHGDYTLCSQFHETNIEPGGFAECFRVPAPNVQLDTIEIPDEMSFEEATLVEPVACCVRAMKKCCVEAGDSVAVIGAGVTGLIHTALSRVYGAAKTIVSDFIDFRLEMAEEFGADVTVNPRDTDTVAKIKAETEGRGADLVVVTAPSLEAYKTAISACRKGGKLCVFAPTAPGKTFEVSPKELFFSEIQVIPSYSTSHLETQLAMQLLKSRAINVKRLITHRFKLEETAQAFKTALETKDSLKVVIVN
jgi:L-iditol 2-dehydrogenase